MDTVNLIEIMDRDGWRKEVPLPSSLVYIGSSSDNHVILDAARGSGVAPRHLQLVPLDETGNQYIAVNLGQSDVSLPDSRTIPPGAGMPLTNGDSIRLGEFTLRFHLSTLSPAVTLAGQSVESAPATSMAEGLLPLIGLSMTLGQTVLMPERPIEGRLLVRNQGTRPGVQFRLELDGLPERCYSLGPAPILFPNGEKEVFLRLLHPKTTGPTAGPVRIRVRASAPDVYPGESATATQTIQIQPFYRYTLRLLPPKPEARPARVR